MAKDEQTLAELFKQARSTAGYSQQQLADETRIPLSFIRAIEEGQQRPANPTYCRGFIRLSCRVLKVDSAPFLGAYQRLLAQQQLTSRFQKKDTLYPPEVLKARPLSFNLTKRSNNRSWLWLLVVLIVIGAFFVAQQLPDEPSYQANVPKQTPQPVPKKTAETTAQTLTLVVKRPVQVMTAFDGANEKQELLLPQTYIFNFNREGQIVIDDTSAVRLWFNDEEIIRLRKGGKQRRLVFRAQLPVPL